MTDLPEDAGPAGAILQRGLTRKDSRGSRRWIVGACLALVLILAFGDVVFLGRTFLTTNFVPATSPDGGSWEYEGRRRSYSEIPVIDPMAPAWAHEPDARLARKMIRRGDLPLWNPHGGCGTPFLASMHPALLFPPKWILLFSDAPWVWDGYILLRLFLAGFFSALYLREIGLGRLPAFFGACAYMLCGFFVWNINIMFVNGAVALPVLFYTSERMVRSPTAGRVAWFGAAVAIAVLSGAAETAAFVLLATAAYTVYRILSLPERRRWLAKRLGGAAAAGLLGAALSAPQWAPFLEALPHLYHTHWEGVGRGHLPLRSLPQLAAPEMFGRIGQHWDGSSPQGDPGYSGALVLLLAAAAVAGGVGRRRPWVFFCGLSLFFLLKIYGFPGFNWLVAQLPLFSRAHLTRWSSPVLFFSLAALAAAALDEVIRGREGRLRGISVAALAALGVVLWAVSPSAVLHGAMRKLVEGLIPPGAVVLVVLVLAEARRRGWLGAVGLGGCLAALLLVELFIAIPRGRLDRSDPFRQPPYVEFLRERRRERPFRFTGMWKVPHPNVASAYGLDDIALTLPFLSQRYMRWIQGMLGPDQSYEAIAVGIWVPDPKHAAMDLMNVRYAVTLPNDPVPWLKGPRHDIGLDHFAAGEILPGREVGQTFLSTEDRLCGITVALANYGRQNRGTLEFRLYEGWPRSDPIRTVSTAMEGIRGTFARLFPFDPVVGSNAKWYTFTLTSPDGAPGNAVTAWIDRAGRYPFGGRLENGERATGDLGFAVYSAPADARYRLVYNDEVLIFENQRALPRAYVVSRAEWVPDQEAALARISEPTFDPRRTVILEGVGAGPSMEGAGAVGGATARITRFEPNRVVISVDLEEEGYLVLLDAHFPGWTVTVDGRPREIYPANGLFRAVPAGRGRHVVEFIYRPLGWRIGVGLAAPALALLGFLAIRWRRSSGRGSVR